MTGPVFGKQQIIINLRISVGRQGGKEGIPYISGCRKLYTVCHSDVKVTIFLRF